MTVFVFKVGFKFVLWQVSYRINFKKEKETQDGIILNAWEKLKWSPLIFVSMTPEVPPGLEICHSLYISIHLLEMVSTSTFAPAHTGAALPRSLPCTWSFTPKLCQVLIGSVWFFPSFSVLKAKFSKCASLMAACEWLASLLSQRTLEWFSYWGSEAIFCLWKTPDREV